MAEGIVGEQGILEDAPKPVAGQGRLCVRGVEEAMCEKCVAIEIKIQRCLRLKEAISDRITVQRLDEMIDELVNERLALHPGRSPHAE